MHYILLLLIPYLSSKSVVQHHLGPPLRRSCFNGPKCIAHGGTPGYSWARQTLPVGVLLGKTDTAYGGTPGTPGQETLPMGVLLVTPGQDRHHPWGTPGQDRHCPWGYSWARETLSMGILLGKTDTAHGDTPGYPWARQTLPMGYTWARQTLPMGILLCKTDTWCIGVFLGKRYVFRHCSGLVFQVGPGPRRGDWSVSWWRRMASASSMLRSCSWTIS